MRGRLRTLVALAVVVAAMFAPTPGPATAGWNDGGNKCPPAGACAG